MKNITTPKDLADFAVEHDLSHDWHEPDNSGVGARIVGDHLDNAFGYRVKEEAIMEGYQEYVVVLTKEGDAAARVNLADLLSWATATGRSL